MTRRHEMDGRRSPYTLTAPMGRRQRPFDWGLLLYSVAWTVGGSALVILLYKVVAP